MSPDGAAMFFNRPNPRSASIRTHTSKDIWPAERQGYSDVHRIAYAPVRQTPLPKQHRRLPIETQERMSTLIVVAGMIAAAHAAISDFSGIWQWHLFPPGPLEICALGVLIWLHAKWRRLVKLS
jgi:hypothetical protein